MWKRADHDRAMISAIQIESIEFTTAHTHLGNILNIPEVELLEHWHSRLLKLLKQSRGRLAIGTLTAIRFSETAVECSPCAIDEKGDQSQMNKRIIDTSVNIGKSEK